MTSEEQAAYERALDMFAWIEMNAKAARNKQLSVVDAYAYIKRDLKLIDTIIAQWFEKD